MLSMSALLWLASRNQLIATNDELYHLLAAQSLLRDGSLSIAFGEYERAGLFTWLIGIGYQLGGESFRSAQLISGVFVSALTASVFLLTYPLIGRRAAAVATVLFALSSNALEVGTTVRFYGIHALLFFLGCMLFFRTLQSEARLQKLWYGSLSGITLLLAFYFQVTTAIGVSVLFGWLLVLGLWLLFQDARISPRVRLAAVFGLLVAAVFTLYLAPLDRLIEEYRYQALWSQATNPRIYYWMMTDLYGVFFGLYPVFAIVAFLRHPRFAIFAVALFVLPVIVHSFGGMRAHRYIFYTLPFFFIVCAIGIVGILEWLYALLKQYFRNSAVKTSTLLVATLPAAILGVAAFILVFANEGYQNGLKSIHQGYAENRRSPPDWQSVEEYVPVDRFEVLVTPNMLQTLYYLNRPNFQFHGDARHEFEIDHRTGLPKISSTESLKKMTECFGSILVLSEERNWGRQSGVGINPESASYIEADFRAFEVPKDVRIRAYYWSEPDSSANASAECADLRTLTSRWPIPASTDQS